MKKLLVLYLLFIIAPVIAGVYGILHDQLTYTISPEYYTKFKFFQFGLADLGDEAIFPNPRLQVSIVGFLATWWVGLPIGLILGFVGMIHKNGKEMFRITMKALFLTLLIAFIAGLVGLAFGKFYLANHATSWYLPENVMDKANYIAVGSMHNFSYLGGLIGLIVAVIFSVRKRNRLKD